MPALSYNARVTIVLTYTVRPLPACLSFYHNHFPPCKHFLQTGFCVPSMAHGFQQSTGGWCSQFAFIP